MKTITLIGAGGKMGCRLTDNFVRTNYKVHYVEVSPKGIENLKQRGVALSTQGEAVPAADVVILAVPDVAIGAVARDARAPRHAEDGSRARMTRSRRRRGRPALLGPPGRCRWRGPAGLPAPAVRGM